MFLNREIEVIIDVMIEIELLPCSDQLQSRLWQ